MASENMRLTLTAIDRALRRAEKVRENSIKARDLFLTLLPGVKNTFNSLPWQRVFTYLKEGKVSKYLVSLVLDYSRDRSVVNGENVLLIIVEVPHGSILGPLL